MKRLTCKKMTKSLHRYNNKTVNGSSNGRDESSDDCRMWTETVAIRAVVDRFTHDRLID